VDIHSKYREAYYLKPFKTKRVKTETNHHIHMKISLLKNLLILSAVIISITSCKKDDKDELDTDYTTARDNGIMDAYFNDVSNISDEASTGSVSSFKLGYPYDGLMSACATVSLDTSVSPKILSIDFGPTDCLCNDGNYRRGKILVSFTGAYADPGHTHTISFDQYFVNLNQVTGTKTVTNNGPNASGHPTFSVSVNGSVVLHSSYGGGTITQTSTRTREWIAGYNTPQWSDDVYLISGTASGTSSKGQAYTMSTLTPLQKEIGFKHFVSGKLLYQRSGKEDITIDYGIGLRDNLATVTIKGYSFNIVLK